MTATAPTVTAHDVERTLLHRYMVEQTGWAALREVTITDRVACEQWRRARDLTGRMGRIAQRRLAAGESCRWPQWVLDVINAHYFRRTLTRRIDVLLIRNSASGKVPSERIAVEIKVDRGDFLRDDAEKRRAWEQAAHRFAYATPPGLVTADEVPDHCGLLYVNPRRFEGRSDVWPKQQVWWEKRAPRLPHEPDPFDDRWVAYLASRAARAEHGGTP